MVKNDYNLLEAFVFQFMWTIVLVHSQSSRGLSTHSQLPWNGLSGKGMDWEPRGHTGGEKCGDSSVPKAHGTLGHFSPRNRSRRWEHKLKTQTQSELGWLGTSIQLIPPSTPSHMAPIWPWTLPRYQFGVCSWRRGGVWKLRGLTGTSVPTKCSLLEARVGTRVSGCRPDPSLFSLKSRRRFWEQLCSGNNGGKTSQGAT